MRWKEITEAPLADFGAYGNMDTEGSFRPDDMRAIKNPKWAKKVEAHFSKTPFDFNLYVVNSENDEIKIGDTEFSSSREGFHKYAGIHPLADAVALIGKEPPNFKNSITCVLTQNEGDGRVPLTPWILAHRVAHALLFAGIKGNHNRFDQEIVIYVEEMLTIIEDLRPIADMIYASDDHSDVVRKSNYSDVNYFAHLVANFGSARNMKIRNWGEFIVECLTEYIVRGKLTLNKDIIIRKNDLKMSGINPALEAIAKKSTSSKQFIQNALKAMRIRRPKGFPHTYYEVYDKQGKLTVRSGNREQDAQDFDNEVAAWREKGYTVNVFSPTKGIIAAHQRFNAKVDELEDVFWRWNDGKYSQTSNAREVLEDVENTLNIQFGQILKICVGKCLFL